MDAARALEEELGAPAPAGLIEALSPADVDRLAGAVRAARRHQRQMLVDAGEKALGHVPRLLRTPVRKIVGMR